MGPITQTLVGLGVVLALAPVGVLIIKRVKTSKTLAAMGGMMLLLAPYVKIEPPRPPPAESIAQDDDDEPLDGASPEV